MRATLRYSLHARDKYLQGGPVTIGFRLENLSSNDVWILRWYTPLEGIRGRILKVTCDGASVPYEGMLMKRGQPETDDYVRLHPGESAQCEFDLSRVYTLPPCRECRLEFKGRIHDVVFDGRQVPRASDEHFAVDVPGNFVVFRIETAQPTE